MEELEQSTRDQIKVFKQQVIDKEAQILNLMNNQHELLRAELIKERENCYAIARQQIHMIQTELTEQIKSLNEEIEELRKPHEKVLNQNKLLTQIFFLKWKYLSSLMNLRKNCENKYKRKLKTKINKNSFDGQDTTRNNSGTLNK